VKVVICNTLYPPLGIGGAERSVKFLAESLVERGHEVIVLSQGTDWKTVSETEKGVQIIRMYSPPGYRPDIYAHRPLSEKVYARLLKKWKPKRDQLYLDKIERIRPDIVHTNSFGQLGKIWKGVSQLGLPVIHTLRNHRLLCERRMFVEGRACEGLCSGCPSHANAKWRNNESLSGVVGISRYILQEYLTGGFFTNVKLRRVIPNSFASDRVTVRPADTDRVFTFGYLGRLHETKGIENLVRAMKHFRGRARLIVGGTGNPHLVKRLKGLAGPNVEFQGFVATDDLLTRVDALAVPSLWKEPFGRIYAESMVHGVPIVGSTNGAGPELLQEGVTGWLCEPSSEPDLVRALQRAMDHLSGPNEIRENCLNFSRRYAPDRVAQEYEAFYEAAMRMAATGSLCERRGLDSGSVSPSVSQEADVTP